MTIQQFLRAAGTYDKTAREWALVLDHYTVEAYGEYEVYLVNSDNDTIKVYTGREPVALLLNDLSAVVSLPATAAGKA
jgi:hypothetical protein